MRYDAIIIGSGLGALGTAHFLSRAGMRVLVLEKNRQFGGALQVFSRDKQILDVGVHYVGSLGREEALGRYFRAFGIYDKLSFSRMDTEGYDRIYIENEEPVKFAQGFDAHIASLQEAFPDEKEGIESYIRFIEKVADHFPLYQFRPGSIDPLSNPFSGKSAYAFICEKIQNPLLRKALTGAGLLYDFRPESSSLYAHSIIQGSFIKSAWKFHQGGAQIARALIQNGKENGVEYRNYSEVKEILTDADGVQGVRLDSGEEFMASRVISNIHPVLTYDFLDNRTKIRPSYLTRIQNLPNSRSCFTAQFIMKEGQFPFLPYNAYIHTNGSLGEIGIFPSKDFENQTYARVINVMSYMEMGELKEWEQTFRTEPHHKAERGASYSDFKQRKEEEIMCIIEKRFPGFREAVYSVYSSTALTWRDYLNYPKGSMYGTIHDYRSPASSVFSPQTKVRGLYLCGQNLNLHGILGASISSAVCSGAILGEEQMHKWMDFE